MGSYGNPAENEGLTNMTNLQNVQSVVTPTPVTNGAVILDDDDNNNERINFVSAGASKKKTPTTAMTADQAYQVAFDYGVSMAGQDGALTKALIAFKDNEAVKTDMLAALNVGYMMRKLSYDKAKATTSVAKKKYNVDPKYHDDAHRTLDEQRAMDSVRVIWHRAQKMAGIIQPKSDNQVQAEVTRAAKEADRKEMETLLNPKDDADVDEGMTRLVSTMKGYYSKHAGKFTGDKGSAWRDWLANAPK